MNTFQIGDRIYFPDNTIQSGTNLKGMSGTIVGEYLYMSSSKRYRVHFDKPHYDFHNCNGMVLNGYGYNIDKHVMAKAVLVEERSPYQAVIRVIHKIARKRKELGYEF